jgi:hypothetical protein
MQPIVNLLEQLKYVFSTLTNEQYSTPVKALSRATIGQHTRHILEFYIELYKGYDNGIVDYDKRLRNHVIESDKFFALNVINEIIDDLHRPDKQLILQVEFGDITTNYFRELIYNMEHTVHHMALIRIGVESISDIVVPNEFGVAASTLKYRQSCAQ